MSIPGSSGPSIEDLQKMGPPYPPQAAGLGGTPTNSVDTPISSVILALFIGSAILHMTIFQRNRKRGHKFVLSGLIFGLSMARITANVMRIVWANYPRNTQIAIAANILTNAGVLLLFVVNLILAQRILRAHHPRLGWHSSVSVSFKILYAIIVALLVMVIISTVYSFYTLDMHTRSQLRDIQLFATTFLAVLAFLPIPIVLMSVLLPRKQPIEHFGKKGSMGTKVLLVLFTSAILALGASFRAGVAFQVRPLNNPAWYHSKACYYCFTYVIEIIVVYLYGLSRFDLRFHIPNGSSQPGHYSKGLVDAEPKNLPIDDEQPPSQAEEREKERQWESNLQNEMDRRESV
ncbi:hypothetical protein QQS21_003499 [Conoideocrella luteorostrata]|uniref:Family c-likeg-protein-coupled receptor protein n=1 Tax=Conoideocrella luteorostrata TaxID=1105319 RepID=A0AAJ0CT65_9HYPO|nr:hypothetical protein QQS21_003499 [Conoideocrella luteorostrata]